MRKLQKKLINRMFVKPVLKYSQFTLENDFTDSKEKHLHETCA